MNIVCNENVSCALWIAGSTRSLYRFTPADGYALWRDNEEGNLDENGNPYCYWYGISATDEQVEDYAAHIWAKLIDDTMEVYGDVNHPETASNTP